jgi:hypothetical protein
LARRKPGHSPELRVYMDARCFWISAAILLSSPVQTEFRALPVYDVPLGVLP